MGMPPISDTLKAPEKRHPPLEGGPKVPKCKEGSIGGAALSDPCSLAPHSVAPHSVAPHSVVLLLRLDARHIGGGL
ncbi:hypothetical protein GCM10010317_073490 [Streptomyces mirabilis]|nr:hypothetical protein GCM10010317_073490 [Streptomyces mirabilis]